MNNLSINITIDASKIPILVPTVIPVSTDKEMAEIQNFNKLSFSEPVIKICQPDEANDYDISFLPSKKCKSDNYIDGTTICHHCYFTELTDKMLNVRRSRRKEFIDYQTDLREDKLQWLDELEDMIVDYEDQFDKADYNIAREYKDIIEEKKKEIDPTIKSKTTDGFTFQLGNAIADAINEDAAPVIQLPPNFKLTALNIKAKNLDIYQSAILFYFLRKHEALINYSDNDLAKFVHGLTGHSEQNLRTTKGFGSIWDIMKQHRKGEDNYNLKVVRTFLQDILADIEQELDSNS